MPDERIVPYPAFIWDIQDVAAFLRQRLGHVLPVLARIYAFIAYRHVLRYAPLDLYFGDLVPAPVVHDDDSDDGLGDEYVMVHGR